MTVDIFLLIGRGRGGLDAPLLCFLGLAGACLSASQRGLVRRVVVMTAVLSWMTSQGKEALDDAKLRHAAASVSKFEEGSVSS